MQKNSYPISNPKENPKLAQIRSPIFRNRKKKEMRERLTMEGIMCEENEMNGRRESDEWMGERA